MASAEFLVKRGAVVTVVDEKPATELSALPMWKKRLPNITYALGRFKATAVTDADLIIRNPSILPSHGLLKKAHRKGIPIHTDISLFFEARPNVDAGITGTRGKSTISALVAHILKQHFHSVYLGGNISISPLSFLDRLGRRSRVVLELSSYLTESLKTVERSPHVACMTNLYPDHLNVHKNFQDYKNAKAMIFRYQTKKDYCVLNADDPTCKRFARDVPATIIWFSLSPVQRKRAVFVRNGKIVSKDGSRETTILSLSDIRLRGQHNVANVCAAVAVARAFGLSASSIRKGVTTFRGLPHRLEDLGLKKGFHFYNDSSSTIPEATLRALETIDQPVILLVGGNDKNVRFTSLAAAKGSVRHAFLLPGSATSKIQTVFRRARIPWTTARSLSDAFTKAVTMFSGGTILLSPAASSFAEFSNEFERGDAFRRLVTSYGA